jgi:flavodoxin
MIFRDFSAFRGGRYLLALGDLWIVGSDPAKELYGGHAHLRLDVEKLTNGNLKIKAPPKIYATFEDLFDFNYWNGLAPHCAASVQCAHGHKGSGVGDVALLRFRVEGKVKDVNEITISKP